MVQKCAKDFNKLTIKWNENVDGCRLIRYTTSYLNKLSVITSYRYKLEEHGTLINTPKLTVLFITLAKFSKITSLSLIACHPQQQQVNT